MKYTLLIKAEAIQDMAEAFNWYEHKRTGLGIEFLDEVEEYYNRISENPEQYQSHSTPANSSNASFSIQDGVCEGKTIVVYASLSRQTQAGYVSRKRIILPCRY